MGVYGTGRTSAMQPLPGSKIAKKFINMPQKRKMKKQKLPLYFEDFSGKTWLCYIISFDYYITISIPKPGFYPENVNINLMSSIINASTLSI